MIEFILFLNCPGFYLRSRTEKGEEEIELEERCRQLLAQAKLVEERKRERELAELKAEKEKEVGELQEEIDRLKNLLKNSETPI